MSLTVGDGRVGQERPRVGIGDDRSAVVGVLVVGRALEVGVQDAECVWACAVDGLAHPVDVSVVACLERSERCEIRIDDPVCEMEHASIVACVGAAQDLECRRIGVGGRVAVDVNCLTVLGEQVVGGAGDGGKVLWVVRMADPSLQ